MEYGLLGYPLTHSFSKKYFEEKFHREGLSHSYTNFEIPNIEEAGLILEKRNLSGLNITIPYKKSILSMLDELDEVALNIGAVNCLKRKGDLWKGYNTDSIGFERSLQPLLKKYHTRALVLGTGGAAQAILYILKKLSIPFTVVSRFQKDDGFSYNALNEEVIREHRLIINTTPIGSFPDLGEAPLIPYSAIGRAHLCYDLVYNPKETLFLKNCFNAGATIKNGFEMLIIQAEESWKIWTGGYTV